MQSSQTLPLFAKLCVEFVSTEANPNDITLVMTIGMYI